MFRLIYTIFLVLFKMGIRISAIANPKAKLWLRGRKGIFKRLENTIPSSNKIIWFHCASLGEFEQGRPVIEKIKTNYPGYKILITFFSPSGYEIRKGYSGADFIFYLPMDSAANAKRFLNIVHPSLVVFVKYEYWHYYLATIKQRNIPLLLISAVFRNDQPFFKWWGDFYRKMLNCFTHIFVQDKQSLALLSTIDETAAISLAGDTRFDRVVEIADQFESIEIIENFCDGNKTIIAGSTWPDDEKMLNTLSKNLTGKVKIIIAPHEINKTHIEEILTIFPEAILYSQIGSESKQPTTVNWQQATSNSVMIIDTIGILSRLYKYAYVTYIGGGFTRDGIHNSLEAAVYGKPVIFGPIYSKYREAVELIAAGGAKSFTDAVELKQIVEKLFNDQDEYKKRCYASREYVQSNAGATRMILDYIQEKRLLTN